MICENKHCSQEIEMHLADFLTPIDEIEVYCPTHFPKDRSDGVVWETEPHDQDPSINPKIRSKIFVRCLTDRAKKHWRGNCFNGGCKPVEEFGKKSTNKNNPLTRKEQG